MIRSARYLFVSMLLSLAVAPVWAQAEEALGDFSTDMEVAVVQIEVRVEDKKKTFISGLGVGDFTLEEDGKQVEVLFVQEISPQARSRAREAIPGQVVSPASDEAPKAEREPSTLVVVVDRANSGPAAVRRQRKHLTAFLKKVRGSEARVGIFALQPNGAFEMIHSFSHDYSAAIATIDGLRQGGGGSSERGRKHRELETMIDEKFNMCVRQQGEGRQMCEQSAIDTLIGSARSFAREERARAQNSMLGIKQILSFSDHLPGRRSMVIISEGIDPGGTSHLNAVGKLVQYYTQTTAVRGAQRYIADIQRAASEFQFTQDKFGDMVEQAIASGITVHWLNPSHSGGIDAFSAESNTGFASGADVVNVADPIAMMRGLAERTGGIAKVKAAGVSGFYDRVADDMRRYYVVGFAPTRNFHDGAEHDIDVKVARKGAKTRARKSYVDHKPETRQIRELASALDFPDVFDEFPSEASLTYLAAAGSRYDVSFRVAAPYRELHPAVRGGRVQSQLHFGFVVRDENLVALHTEHPIINIAQEIDRFNELSEAGAYIDYRQGFNLAPGAYWLVAAVLDGETGRSSTQRFKLLLPELGAACLSITPLMLASVVQQSAEAVDGVEIDEQGNVLYGQRKLSFSSLTALPSSGRLTGLYQLLNASKGNEGNTSVELFFRLSRGREVVSQTAPKQVQLSVNPSTRSATSLFDVPYNSLAAGEYLLELIVHDVRSGCDASAAARFRIVAQAAAVGADSSTSSRQASDRRN